jgi:hypothetical protein
VPYSSYGGWVATWARLAGAETIVEHATRPEPRALRDVEECWPSAVWRRITRQSGVGLNVTALDWNGGCAGISSRTNKSWRVDENYIRVEDRWCYLYQAIDSTGATIDFLLSALRDAAAVQPLFRKALSDPTHPQPGVSLPMPRRHCPVQVHAGGVALTGPAACWRTPS